MARQDEKGADSTLTKYDEPIEQGVREFTRRIIDVRGQSQAGVGDVANPVSDRRWFFEARHETHE
jgi:hypothetical protein